MTATRNRQGKPLHFPPPGCLSGAGVPLTAPSAAELQAFADAVAPKSLPLFVAGLVKTARRRRYQPRWTDLNRARIELARLCLDRMLAEGLDVPTQPDLHLCMACP